LLLTATCGVKQERKADQGRKAGDIDQHLHDPAGSVGVEGQSSEQGKQRAEREHLE
jgi:hypothetical protein